MARCLIAVVTLLACQPQSVAANPMLEVGADPSPFIEEPEVEEPRLKTLLLMESTTKVAQVVLDVSITETAAVALERTLADLPPVGYVVLVIDSPGGLLSASRDMARIIESHPQRIVCVVDGIAASGAYYILQSCPMRLMTGRSNLMLHEAFNGEPPNDNGREALKAINLSMAYQQCRRLSMPVAECHARYQNGREWWLTPEKAIKAGAVDGIVDTPMQVMVGLSETAAE